MRAHRRARGRDGGIADNVGSVRVLGANVPSHVGRVEDAPAAMRAASGDAIQRSFAERLLEGGVPIDPGPAERQREIHYGAFTQVSVEPCKIIEAKHEDRTNWRSRLSAAAAPTTIASPAAQDLPRALGGCVNSVVR